jgi:hypothetical protein
MLWEEERLQFEEVPSLNSLYNQIPNAELLLLQLEYERGEELQKGNTKRVEMLGKYMIRLMEILNSKWDEASQQILQHLDMFSREATENFQIASQYDKYSYGLWANMTRNPRHKLIEFSECMMGCSVPKPLALDHVGIMMLYNSGPNSAMPFEAQRGDTQYAVIGGVLRLDLVELPDPPKRVDPWTIRPILNRQGKLNRLVYPFAKPSDQQDENNSMTDPAVWATQVNYVIPSNCYIDTSAKVMFWDYSNQCWSNEDIKDAEVDHGIAYSCRNRENSISNTSFCTHCPRTKCTC